MASVSDPWQFYRARAYRADAGRFVQRDPLRYIDSANQYAYALDRPLDFTDSLGTDCASWTAWQPSQQNNYYRCMADCADAKQKEMDDFQNSPCATIVSDFSWMWDACNSYEPKVPNCGQLVYNALVHTYGASAVNHCMSEYSCIFNTTCQSKCTKDPESEPTEPSGPTAPWPGPMPPPPPLKPPH